MHEITLKEFRIKLEKGISSSTINRALNRGCIVVENEAKHRCPVGKTGLLRNSISHRVDGNEGIIGTTMDYAPYVEYGTGIYARDGNGRKTPWIYRTADGEFHFTEGQHPQPFLEPSLEEKVQEVGREMLKTITGELFA